VNSVRAAVEGRGITRLFSYHIAEHLSLTTLQTLTRRAIRGALHLIFPQGPVAVPKVRAFVDFAVSASRRIFLVSQATPQGNKAASNRGVKKVPAD
jgi:DNA-binding transcriptional LysR family regulator